MTGRAKGCPAARHSRYFHYLDLVQLLNDDQVASALRPNLPRTILFHLPRVWREQRRKNSRPQSDTANINSRRLLIHVHEYGLPLNSQLQLLT